MQHRQYTFDRVYGESEDNVVVSRGILEHAVGGGTVLCYGQTGTGKTYTFSGLIGTPPSSELP